MTADRQWQAAGMGSGTETYLAGPDSLMRSDSRLFLQDPEEYRKQVVAAGTSLDVVNRAIQFGGTTLLQPVATEGLRAAQRGQTGTVTSTDYTGSRELEAYAPLNVPDSDLHWSILATRNDSEAFAAVASFSRALVLVTVGIIVVICVASMLIAHAMVRPIRRLEVGTQKISAGDYEVNIPVKSRDEIGDLTAAFNEMSRNLQTKEELLNEQRKENDRLLLSMMPEPVVERYRLGSRPLRRSTKMSPSCLPTSWVSTRFPAACRVTNWSKLSTSWSASSIRPPNTLVSNAFARCTMAISPVAG